MENEQEKMDRESSSEDLEKSGQFKEWLQDNLRVLISVFIVLVLAAGIYSYSGRTPVTEEETVGDELATIESILGTQDERRDSSEEPAKEDTKASEEEAKKEDSSDSNQKEESDREQGEDRQIASGDSTEPKSSETQDSFIETAVRGDGTTKLARRALANYLEKNPDSSLTAEHKIYIEDYLRKRVGHSGRVHVGTSIEFNKSLIEEAIGNAKRLNEAQLKNLEKYSARVPSLS